MGIEHSLLALLSSLARLATTGLTLHLTSYKNSRCRIPICFV